MRPIDAEHLKHEVNRIDGFAGCADVSEKTLIGFNMMIDLEPTVGTVPVVHAHWIPCEDKTGEGSNTYKCSSCGGIQILIDGTPKENGWEFCPHCGAKME